MTIDAQHSRLSLPTPILYTETHIKHLVRAGLQVPPVATVEPNTSLLRQQTPILPTGTPILYTETLYVRHLVKEGLQVPPVATVEAHGTAGVHLGEEHLAGRHAVERLKAHMERCKDCD